MISDKDVAFYRDNGYLLVENVLEPGTLREMKSVIADWIEKARGVSKHTDVYDLEPESNPLQLYLDSLTRYEALAADTLVLPSHGKPFTGLHARIRQLREHHVERLADVMAACRDKPCHAAELLGVLFRRVLDLHQTTFAMGESVAHLHALWHGGQLARERGGDGIWRFRAVP